MQLALSVLGIVLGVAIVTAVLITNQSSSRAFTLSSEALYGRTTHQLLGADGVDQTRYVELVRKFPGLRMAPIIEGNLAIGREVFTLLGVDPFAESGFDRAGTGLAQNNLEGNRESKATQQPGIRTAIERLLEPDALLISAATQKRLQLPLDEPLIVTAGGRTRQIQLLGEFQSDNPAASEGVLLGDIALVQTLLNRQDKIDRIDLILDEAELDALREQLPPNLRLAKATSRQETMQAMTRGFQINLTAMSLLALVVGAFLIHNTMTFAVLQRREIFATLRISGVTSRSILLTVLAEAFVISSIASTLGILVGLALAQALIRLTTQTINDLYFVLHVQEVSLSPATLALGMVLGIGSSIAAASLSAWEAASTSPLKARQRSHAEQRTRNALPWLAMCGGIVMLIGTMLAFLPSQSLLVGFAALMFLILGYGLAVPWAVQLISARLKPLATHLGVNLSLAIGGIERNISRTGLAIAALCIAVSATFGVDVMIGSFRATVDKWLGDTLQSDIYVSAPTTVSAQSAALLDARVQQIARTTPGITGISTGRLVDAATNVGTIDMLVLTSHQRSEAGFELIDGDVGSAWQSLNRDDALLISEPLATRHSLAVGDSLNVFTSLEGDQPFRIVGIFRDYGSSHGKLLMARSVFDRYWDDERIGSLGLLIDPLQAAEPIVNRLRERLTPIEQPLLVRSNRAIRENSLAVFDRTFEVTRVLRLLTIGVAFVGIFSALLALHLERAREFAVLRASGATQRQIMSIVTFQTVAMGTLAGLAALPLGWIMSEVLIRIINVRSFGWSMDSLLPAGAVSETLTLAILSALLAGLYPAWRLSRSAIAAQLRDE